MKQKQSSIQWKLMRLALITSGVVLLLTCIGFFTYDFFTFRQNNKNRISTLGEIIAANSTAALAFQSVKEADEILNALKAEKHIVEVGLYDDKGNLFARYPLTLAANKFPSHPGIEGYNYEDGYLKGYQPVIHQNKRLGTLYLQSDLNAIYQRFEKYALIALLVIGISVFVAYFLSRKLQKSISQPILALVKAAGNISERKDYSARAEKFDNDELGTLTDAFNQMVTQIEGQNAAIISFNQALELKVNERTSELEQANIELKLKSEFEETIIDSSVDIIAVFDKELKYVALNRYGQQIYGVSNKDIIGKNILEIFPQVKFSVMYDYLQRTFDTGEMMLDSYYSSYISDRVLQNYFIPLFDKDGNVYRVLVMGHDITEISRTNDKLKLVNKELEKSNHDLEQFAFIASHDLQEPLRKIQTFSQLLGNKIDDKEAAETYLSKIISSAARMSDLIKAVLNYSRLSGEKEQRKPVDLNEVLENIQTDLELTIIEKQAVITADKLLVLHGNPLQLHQLFLNLISNSIKFCKHKPEIKITSAVLNGDETELPQILNKKAKYVEIVFADNGIGFEQQYANKIFTVFQRLHGRNEFPGTGIGLALCKKIIDNHNGHISVTSKINEGTIFKIQLPLDVAAS